MDIFHDMADMSICGVRSYGGLRHFECILPQCILLWVQFSLPQPNLYTSHLTNFVQIYIFGGWDD